jgi:hypothetical protein
MKTTPARIPAGASDQLLYRLHIEGRRNTPVNQRSTCPTHLNWRDRCAQQHGKGTA